jgi:hypothetical protein
MKDRLDRSGPAAGPTYALGRVAFTVTSSNAAFERELARLLPRPHTAPDTIHAFSVESDVRAVIRAVLAFHRDCRWIHAACLRSPEGRTVLLAGRSGAGKSTTALALALGFGWKVLADDLTLIDPATNAIVALAAPFSLKGPAPALLHEAIGTAPGPLVLGEWFRIDELYAAEECQAAFDLLVHLGWDSRGNGFAHSPCSAAEYTRLLLPSSSMLHDAGGPDGFAEAVGSGACHWVMGGNVSERLNLVLELNRQAR